MTPDERRSLIERYAGSYEAVQIALFQIGTYSLDEAPEGEWTPRQIVHHLADAEVIRSARLQLLLAGTEPRLPGFNESDFVTRLDYARPLDSSMALLRAALDANMELLLDLPEADWQRTGTLEGDGRFSMEDWLRRAAGHSYEHGTQLQSYVGATLRT